jgi:hypothetical protein
MLVVVWLSSDKTCVDTLNYTSIPLCALWLDDLRSYTILQNWFTRQFECRRAPVLRPLERAGGGLLALCVGGGGWAAWHAVLYVDLGQVLEHEARRFWRGVVGCREIYVMHDVFEPSDFDVGVVSS